MQTKIKLYHICCLRSFFSWMKHFASFYSDSFFSLLFIMSINFSERFAIWLHNFVFWLILYLLHLLAMAKVKSIKIIIESIEMHLLFCCFSEITLRNQKKWKKNANDTFKVFHCRKMEEKLLKIKAFDDFGLPASLHN